MFIGELKDDELKNKLRKFVFDVVGSCQEVHKVKGAELTEFVYQECLDLELTSNKIKHKREYTFHPSYKGHTLKSRLRVDFLCKDKIFVECKAIEQISTHERIQLTNYMRNAGIRIGILYNFAPLRDECEKYYYDPTNNNIYYF